MTLEKYRLQLTPLYCLKVAIDRSHVNAEIPAAAQLQKKVHYIFLSVTAKSVNKFLCKIYESETTKSNIELQHFLAPRHILIMIE